MKKCLPIPVKFGDMTWYAHGPMATTTFNVDGSMSHYESWPEDYIVDDTTDVEVE